jgi:hypothetical protein
VVHSTLFLFALAEQELLVFLESDVLTDTSTIMRFQNWMDENKPFWIEKSNKYYNLRKGTPAELEMSITHQ